MTKVNNKKKAIKKTYQNHTFLLNDSIKKYIKYKIKEKMEKKNQ